MFSHIVQSMFTLQQQKSITFDTTRAIMSLFINLSTCIIEIHSNAFTEIGMEYSVIRTDISLLDYHKIHR